MTAYKTLVVADNQNTRTTTAAMLDRIGHIVTASVGIEGLLENANSLQPDVVLIDIEPDSGPSRNKELQQLFGQINRPVIYLISESDLETLEANNPIIPYLLIFKPFTPGQLKVVIETAIHQFKRYHELENTITNFKRNEDLYRTAILTSQDAISITRLDGTLTEVNSGFVKLTGYSRDEILGKTTQELDIWVRSEDRDHYIEAMQSRGEIQEFETKFKCKDGIIKNGLVSARMIQLEDEPHIMSVTQDITQKKDTEASLQESQSSFIAFMDNVPAAVFIKDSQGRFTYLNQYYRDTLGAEESWIGKTTLDVIKPETLARKMMADDQKALASGLLITEEEGRDTLGRHRYYRTIKFPVVQSGKPDLLGGFALDITAQKRSEKLRAELHDLALTLSRTDDLNKTLTLCLDTAISASNMDCGSIHLVDEITRELSMVSHQGLSEDFVQNASQYKKDSPFVQVITKGNSLFFQYQDTMFSRDPVGQAEGLKAFGIIPVLYENRVIACLNVASHTMEETDEENQAVLDTIAAQIGGAIHNSRTRRALLESEQKYRSVVDNANETICVAQDGMFKYFNPRLTELTGYSEAELHTKPFIDLIHPTDQPLIIDRHLRRLEGEHPEEIYSFRIVTKDNDTRWVEIKPVRILWEDQPATLNFLTDITERKRSQELVIQTEKMLSLGGLAAGMAHEINNPLGAIMQTTQNIQRRFSPELEGNLKAAETLGLDLDSVQKYMTARDIHLYIQRIKESGQRAANIISDMLKFSRNSESNLAPIDLNKLLNEAIDLAGQDFDLKKSTDFKNIEIKREFDERLPQIPCTETEITQVILNLLTNAAQALFKSNGKTASCITLRTLMDRDHAQIEIIDNGPGIETNIIKKIFDPFFTTKAPGEGTGLGLSVSYMIITLNHKGTLEVESEVNKGTRFIIRLPLKKE